MQKNYDQLNGESLFYYYILIVFKKIFGVRRGWQFWFICRFVWKYGFESMDLNYVYPRKVVKNNADKQYVYYLEGSKSLRDLSEKYKIYIKEKENKEHRNNFLNLLKARVEHYINCLSFQGLELLFLEYSTEEKFIKTILFERVIRLSRRNDKYKKQRLFFIVCIVLLLFLISFLILAFFGNTFGK